ncbi:ABC-2 type transport system ATP-binding protein [Microcella alkaliphila]|uniref:ABC-2 type transport system ATP-binding protein n=1 Tax=Microcella alkaliphila TaxID=279828 RepID=A0A4Q7TU95_9MICO|nr:ABC transporter ATP-binding protein [Microcella alkaliphila]RZT64333.1 ABC-2 type transport system ATP-binding protein [Microcella alkaliphila]
MTRDIVVRARGVAMSYGAKRVLDSIDLDIHRGEVIALLGANGAGKTTTIEILEGVRSPTAGTVEVLGIDPVRAGVEHRARVGVVLQSWRDHGRWRVREFLHHFFVLHSPFRKHDSWAVDDLLERVGLADKARARIMSLSGGQRRRLDVAVGLMGNPELLFLDEPTAGFDPHARREFHELMHELVDARATTILLTTHDLAEAERLADRILILHNGRIAANGSADALAREVAGTTEVRWTARGERFVHSTESATRFVRDLLARDPDVDDLEVRRTTLEDTYLTMVAQHEAADAETNGERA